MLKGIGLYTVLSFCVIYLLWFYYLAVMNLMGARNDHTLTGIGLIFGYPIFVVGYILDILVNWFILSIILVEFPSEWTVTSRLSRHISDSENGYRKTVSEWFCKHLLNPFDPSGCHCKKELP